jgi:hypothetical protein
MEALLKYTDITYKKCGCAEDVIILKRSDCDFIEDLIILKIMKICELY